MARILSALASILLLVPAAAQTAPNQSTMPLLVNVLDRNGNAVRTLTKDSFRVKVNGHPAAVVDADYSLAPRRIVVLLDMSGSMAGETEKSAKWKISREALEDFLAESPADVRVSVLTFSSQVHDVFDFSQSRSSVATWLKDEPRRRTEIKGTTALYDAVLAATKLLQPARPGDSIYVITDGGDNSSHISESETRKLLLQSGIRLFVFLFAEPIPFAPERLPSVMALARATGGFVFGVSGRHLDMLSLPSWNTEYSYDEHARERIRLYTQALNIQANGFYNLHLDAAPPATKPNKVSLEVVDESGNVKKDVAWTYPEALQARAK